MRSQPSELSSPNGCVYMLTRFNAEGIEGWGLRQGGRKTRLTEQERSKTLGVVKTAASRRLELYGGWNPGCRDERDRRAMEAWMLSTSANEKGFIKVKSSERPLRPRRRALAPHHSWRVGGAAMIEICPKRTAVSHHTVEQRRDRKTVCVLTKRTQ